MDTKEIKARGVGVPEAAELIGISVPQLWRIVKAGKIKTYRIGRRVNVPISEIDRHTAPGSYLKFSNARKKSAA